MKRCKATVIFLAVLTMGFVFTACSNKSKYDKAITEASKTTAVSAPQKDYMTEYGNTDLSGDAADNALLAFASGLTGTSGVDNGNNDILSMEKIITKVNLEVETQDFDNLIASIKDDISRLGGYEEKTEISGRRYYSSNTSRYAYIIARIPGERLKEFVKTVKDNGNVVNESSTSENVTLQYVDTQSRKKALEIEQERLFALLEKTESLEDIVTLESRLSSIRHELQMYETELRTIDNQVDYSTVTITIYEVDRITPIEEKETMAVRIKNGLSNTIYNISEGFKNFVVWFFVNLPYIIMWAAVITVLALVFRKIHKKIRNKKGNTRSVAEKLSSDKADNSDNKID